MDALDYRDAVPKGLSTGDWGDLTWWLTEESSFCYDEALDDLEPFDDDVLQVLTDFLGQDSFRSALNSHQALQIIEYDWARLSESQRNRLLPALEAAYPAMRDEIALFYIAELLGHLFRNREALDALLRLRSIPASGPRSQIAVGLAHTVLESSDKTVREIARNNLISMQNDPSPEVRNEVESALRKIISE